MGPGAGMGSERGRQRSIQTILAGDGKPSDRTRNGTYLLGCRSSSGASARGWPTVLKKRQWRRRKDCEREREPLDEKWVGASLRAVMALPSSGIYKAYELIQALVRTDAVLKRKRRGGISSTLLVMWTKAVWHSVSSLQVPIQAERS